MTNIFGEPDNAYYHISKTVEDLKNMNPTVKSAWIIGICLILGLWGAGWLSRSDAGRFYLKSSGDVFDTESGGIISRDGTYFNPVQLHMELRD